MQIRAADVVLDLHASRILRGESQIEPKASSSHRRQDDKKKQRNDLCPTLSLDHDRETGMTRVASQVARCWREPELSMLPRPDQ